MLFICGFVFIFVIVSSFSLLLFFKKSLGKSKQATTDKLNHNTTDELQTEAQKKYSLHWEAQLKNFLAKAEQLYPTDARVRKAVDNFSGKIRFATPKTKELQSAVGWYVGSPGSIYLNANFFKNVEKNTGKDPKDDSVSKLVFLLLHELAHTNGIGHDDVWENAFVFFLKIARNNLGWACSKKCQNLLK